MNNKNTVCTKYYGDYLNILYKFDKRDELYEHAKSMHTIFESDWVSLRWICKLFNEEYVESETMIEEEENISNYCEALLKLESPSPTALFTKSILLVNGNKLIDAKELLEQIVSLLPGLLHAWILLLKCCIDLFLFFEAIQAANKVDKLLQNSNNNSKEKLKKKVSLLMIESLSRSDEEQDLKRALELYTTVFDLLKWLFIFETIKFLELR